MTLSSILYNLFYSFLISLIVKLKSTPILSIVEFTFTNPIEKSQWILLLQTSTIKLMLMLMKAVLTTAFVIVAPISVILSQSFLQGGTKSFLSAVYNEWVPYDSLSGRPDYHAP